MGGEARNDATTRRRNEEGGEGWRLLLLTVVIVMHGVSCGEWDSSENPPYPGDDDTAGDDDTPGDDDTTSSDDDDTTPGDDDDTTASDDDTASGDDDTSGPADCSPGPGTGEADECEFLASMFYGTVSNSVLTVVDDHPEWFEEGGGTWFVLQTESYMDSVVSLVNTYNLCAIRDPNAGDEIAVKHDNAFAESFDILTWDGYVRYGEGIYNATCSPAWF